nr:MAG TPA: hypothetical protein [Herelleviridae sp.]
MGSQPPQNQTLTADFPAMARRLLQPLNSQKK